MKRFLKVLTGLICLFTMPAYPLYAETEPDIAYKTIIDSDEGTTLRLLNGAEVETTSEYYGGAGYKKHAILYTRHGQWKILIEGKTPLDCTVNKMPVYGVPCVVEELTITEIKGQGDRPLLVMADGSIYEPKNVYPLTRSVWARSPRGLLMNGYELINLGRERERIEVTKVR